VSRCCDEFKERRELGGGACAATNDLVRVAVVVGTPIELKPTEELGVVTFKQHVEDVKVAFAFHLEPKAQGVVWKTDATHGRVALSAANLVHHSAFFEQIVDDFPTEGLAFEVKLNFHVFPEPDRAMAEQAEHAWKRPALCHACARTVHPRAVPRGIVVADGLGVSKGLQDGVCGPARQGHW
jgi:hypothetical protein